MNSELPQGWTSASVGEVASRVVVGYVGPSRQHYDAQGIPFLMGKNVRASRLLLDDLERVTPDFHARERKSQLSPNDVIVVRIGRSGTAVVIPDSLGPANCGGLVIVKNPTATLPNYLAHYLNSPEGQRASLEETRGVTRQTLNTRSVEAASIPIAPLAEQQRIVAKLEKLLGKVDTCQQRLARIPVLLKRFRQSVLAAACSGRLTADWREDNPEGGKSDGSEGSPDGFPALPETWGWKQLEAVCDRIVDCPHSTPTWSKSGRLCARTTNFKPGFLDLSEVRYVSNETYVERIERLRPQPGDILYSREGGILGIACMIPPEVELCLGQRMMLFRTNLDFSPALLMHWLNSPAILRRVQELTGGSASPHLNVKEIKKFPTPVPPEHEQQEIVRRVTSLFALADRIEVRFTEGRKRVDSLTQSILAKAFRGELVQTEAELAEAEGRSFESAGELLKRIERNGEPKGKKIEGPRGRHSQPSRAH
jgi:type I restriction enzyme S subunit